MTHVTCRLTGKNRDQLRNPTLGNRVWASFTFTTLFEGSEEAARTSVLAVKQRRERESSEREYRRVYLGRDRVWRTLMHVGVDECGARARACVCVCVSWTPAGWCSYADVHGVCVWQ